MATSPQTSSLAAVTQALPGPTMWSTGSRPAPEAVREGGDRLGAARDEELVDVEQAGGAEQDRVDVAIGPVGGGLATTIALHAREPRRDDAHQQRATGRAPCRPGT